MGKSFNDTSFTLHTRKIVIIFNYIIIHHENVCRTVYYVYVVNNKNRQINSLYMLCVNWKKLTKVQKLYSFKRYLHILWYCGIYSTSLKYLILENIGEHHRHLCRYVFIKIRVIVIVRQYSLTYRRLLCSYYIFLIIIIINDT